MMPLPYAAVVRQFHAAPPGKLFCLHGSAAVFRLSLRAAAQVLASGVPMTLVDGTNRFDVYFIAEFARRLAERQPPGAARTPDDFLRNIFVSRAFTCYQMEAVVTDRLPAFVQTSGSPMVMIFGPLDTFYDDQAPFFEVRRSVGRMIAALHGLKQRHVSVLLASTDLRPASEERRTLFPRLAAAMDRVFRVTEEHGGLCVRADQRDGARAVASLTGSHPAAVPGRHGGR